MRKLLSNKSLVMKIRDIIKFLIILPLFLSSLVSFSQNRSILQKHKKTKVSDGYILWTSLSKCQLIDRKDNPLFNFPGNLVSFYNSKEMIASHIDGNIVTFNKNLDVQWKVPVNLHHELYITPSDNIMVLATENHEINNVKIRLDVIVCFDSTGKKIFRWSVFENRRYLMNLLMKDTSVFHYKIKGSNDPDSVLFEMAPKLFILPWESSLHELFHMNAIQVIPENESEEKDSIFRKGNILLSFCNNNKFLDSFVAIVDPIQYKILWYYVPKGKNPIHTPVMMPNGHILVYLNSYKGNSSSIIEINPINKEIVWEYTETFSKAWSCGSYGSCQRLPNGNTLISNNLGYIYEITHEKKIVWKWFNIEKNENVYRAYWYPKGKLDWLVNEK